MDLAELNTRYDRLSGEKDSLLKLIEKKNFELEDMVHRSEVFVKARWVLSEVARLTQERFKEKVETLVTTAIRAVFDRPFKFVLEFERKRNKLECRPVIKEGDVEYVPKDDMGGGIIDVLSFALRVVMWSLQRPRTRNVIVLDEPMKYVGKGELLDRAGRMLREVSKGLGIQLILVTHEPQLIEIADRAYSVRHNGKKSVVDLVKGEKPKRVRRRK